MTVQTPSTNADPRATTWAITDPVIHLRRFGSEAVFDLSASDRWVLGASSECSIPLDDPSGRISRRHLELSYEANAWTARDLGSTNGLRHDRADRRLFQIVPGDELELGGVTLIAESRRSAELHELLRRLLGWSADRAEEVDRALRAVREMANLRAVLILHGEGDLSGVARRLHQVTLGDRPCVVLGKRERGTSGLRRAGDGMLHVDAGALPQDAKDLVAGLRAPTSRVRLVVGAATAAAAAQLATLIPRVATIWIPPLAERMHDLDRLLDAYGLDAMAELGAPALGFRPYDRKWARAGGVRTLEELEDVTRRLVALRNWGVAGGARRLAITHGALSRWALRRNLPT